MSTANPQLALIAIGSNIDPAANLLEAVREMSRVGVVLDCSQVWQSKPVGYLDQDDFCNAAVKMITTLNPDRLRAALRRIEDKMGRERDPSNKNAPRNIDLDIACYGRAQIFRDDWVTPDPQIVHRSFMAQPLSEVDPQYRLPGDGRTLIEIAEELREIGDPLTPRADIDLRLGVAVVDADVQQDRMPSKAPKGAALPIPRASSPHLRSLQTLNSMPLSTIEHRFCYGHRLLNYDGKCRHLHGHTARLELKLLSGLAPEDWDQHRAAFHNWVDDALDSKMILRNDDPALEVMARLGEPVYLVGTNPTTENLAKLVFDAASELGVPVAEVRMWESPRCSAIYQATPAVTAKG